MAPGLAFAQTATTPDPARDAAKAEVTELDMMLMDGEVQQYRAKVKVSFKYRDD